MAMTPNPYKCGTGISRVIKAFFYSLAGLKAAWKEESAFRYVIVEVLVLEAIALCVSVNKLERIFLMLVPILMIVVELLNSAIEAAVDHTSMEIHPLAKQAKDMGSAAQLVTMCLVGAVWLGILFL